MLHGVRSLEFAVEAARESILFGIGRGSENLTTDDGAAPARSIDLRSQRFYSQSSNEEFQWARLSFRQEAQRRSKKGEFPGLKGGPVDRLSLFAGRSGRREGCFRKRFRL